MRIDDKILKEIARYNSINKYIMEQDIPAPPADAGAIPPPPADAAAPVDPAADPAAAGADPAAPTPPAAPGAEGEPVDVAADPDVEEVPAEGEEGEGETEELDITDLVDSQKTIADKQEEYFTNLFDQIKTMEEKLAEMDTIVSKLDTLEAKVEKYRPKTAQEKLELRSLDSGPYSQKLSDFFTEKEPQMQQQGKEQYILTPDDVENYDKMNVRKSFDVGLQN